MKLIEPEEFLRLYSTQTQPRLIAVDSVLYIIIFAHISGLDVYDLHWANTYMYARGQLALTTLRCRPTCTLSMLALLDYYYH